MAEEGYVVKLHVYDLSQGLARQLSATFLGKAIEAVWHTGLVAYGKEYYFSGGIQQDPAGRTLYETPIQVVELGITHLPMEVFEDYLQEISPRYTAETYNLLSHNCNNFTNEVAQFLVGTTIPDYILQLPNEVLNSPMGGLLLPMIQRLETSLRSGAVPQAPQFVPPAATAITAQSVEQVNFISTPCKVGASGSEATNNKAVSQSSQEVIQENVTSVPSAKISATATEQKKPVVADPLGEARRKVQEEITKEFTAIMATGTLRASEAAALATRRVMERHGRMNVPMQQG